MQVCQLAILARGLMQRFFFSLTGSKACLAQLIIDFSKLSDQCLETAVFLNLFASRFKCVLRDVVTDGFLMFIFTGQLPAQMAGVAGFGAMAIGSVTLAVKGGQVARSQLSDFGDLLQKVISLRFEEFDCVHRRTMGWGFM